MRDVVFENDSVIVAETDDGPVGYASYAKQVLSNIRRAAEDEPSTDVAVPLGQVELTQQPVEEPTAHGGFCLESAGPVEASGGELTIPILLTESESGQKVELRLRLSISES